MRAHLRIAGLVMAAAVIMMPLAAQNSGAEIYKSKCQSCHGATGMADSGAGKALKVKPANSPEVKKMAEAQMIDAVRNGMGKMQPYKGKLTDAEIKGSVEFFRTFVK